MKKVLVFLAIITLLIAALPVWAQANLDGRYVSQDKQFLFDYPLWWELEVDEDGTVVVYDEDTTIYVYGPQQVAAREWTNTDPVVMLDTILAGWQAAGDTVSEVTALENGARRAALGFYIYDEYPGLLLLVELSDGSLGGIEAIGNKGETEIAGFETALALAATFDVVEREMMVEDFNNAWIDAIAVVAPPGNQ